MQKEQGHTESGSETFASLRCDPAGLRLGRAGSPARRGRLGPGGWERLKALA